MSLRQLPTPKMQFFNSSGGILSGGKVYTYIAGTTTAKATYSDSAGSTPNANPIILDSRGEATIYWDGTYKVVVKDSSDVTIYTVDNHGTGLDPVAVPQLSLVKNYSFETATADADTPDNWTITLYTNGTQVLDDTAGNQIHGAKSIKFTSAGSGGGYAESDLFEVQESVPMHVAVAIKSSVAGVRNLIEAVWYDRSELLLSTSSLYDDSTTNPTSWTDKNLNATPPSNARFAKVRVTGCHSSDSTVGSAWFDNVRVHSVADEGTFSPGVEFGGGTTGITYSTRAGIYTKIGRWVHVQITLVLSSKGSSAGTARLTGLPFSTDSSHAAYAPLFWNGMTSSFVSMSLNINAGGNSAGIYGLTAAATSSVALTSDADFGNTTSLYTTFAYLAAE